MGKGNKGKSKAKVNKNTNDPQELKVNITPYLTIYLSFIFTPLLYCLSQKNVNHLESWKQDVRVEAILRSI
jgi:hypothetical protein